MRYLITTENYAPFFTDWFDAANHFNEDYRMVVFDLAKGTYTTDGKTWHHIEADHL